jgi:hypothetical protein
MIWSHSAIELEVNRTNTIAKPLKSQFNYNIVNGTCIKESEKSLNYFKVYENKSFGFIHLFLSV